MLDYLTLSQFGYLTGGILALTAFLLNYLWEKTTSRFRLMRIVCVSILAFFSAVMLSFGFFDKISNAFVVVSIFITVGYLRSQK